MNYFKKSFFILILINALILNRSIAQNTFFSSYGVPFADGIIISSQDNNFVGLGGQAQNVYIYKMDFWGNMVWIKQIPFTFAIAPIQIVSLADSCFAFMCKQQVAPFLTYIFKADLNGNLIWTKSLSIGSSVNFLSLASTTDGGLILTGGGCAGSDMVIHISCNGNILSQHAHTTSSTQFPYPNAFDMVHDGNNQYSYLGYAGSGPNIHTPLIFYRTDSAGNAYNYTEFHFPFGCAHSWDVGSKYLAKSTSGGHFCTFSVNDTIQNNNFILFYLNSQDQLVWFKYITTQDTVIAPSYLLATSDGGCLLVGRNMISLNYNPYPKYLPFAIKFDLSGNVEWSKMLGDVTSSYWDRMGIRSVVPTDDNGWIMNVNRSGYFNICKVDSAFDGFCNTTPFTPIVTDFTPIVNSYTLTSNIINFVEDSLSPIINSVSFNRIDECSTLNIDNPVIDNPLFYVFPNPASTEFQISSRNFGIQTGDEILLRDVLGKSYFTKKISSPTSNIRLQTSNFSNGIYFLELKTKEGVLNKKVVVQH